MKKILYFDVETTGIDCHRHGIIQLSGMFEINGAIHSEFDFKIKPFEWDHVDDEALLVTGYTRDQLKTFMDPWRAFQEFELILKKHIDKFDRSDKFYPAGYNVRFDLDFLNMFFKKNRNVYFGSFCNWKALDVLALAHYLDSTGKLKLPNYKLATICEYFAIPIKAHDSLSDIKATREVLKKLENFLQIPQPSTNVAAKNPGPKSLGPLF